MYVSHAHGQLSIHVHLLLNRGVSLYISTVPKIIKVIKTCLL